MYCSLQQARDAGTTGTDAEVTAWILAAEQRIEGYTLQVFEPRVITVVGDVGADGLVILPRRVRTVTSVTPVGIPAAAPLPASSYRVTSSATPGAVDAVQLAYTGYDDLIAGAESWNGGYAGLFRRWAAEQVEVVVEVGLDEPPLLVAHATALLAAWLQGEATSDDTDSTVDDGLDVDDEGNNVRISDDDEASATPVHPRASTGYAKADALLAGYINATPTVPQGV